MNPSDRTHAGDPAPEPGPPPEDEDPLGLFDDSNPFEESASPVETPLLEESDFDLSASLRDARQVIDQGGKATYTVLVADDDENTRRILSRYLTSAGIQPIEDNGKDVLRKIAQFKVDLVLMDIVFPHTTGFEICKEIKASHALAHIPVVMCTAKKTKESIVKAAGVGASGYIVKPFTRETILEKITDLRKKQAIEGPPPSLSVQTRPTEILRADAVRVPGAETVRLRKEAALARGLQVPYPFLIIDDERLARHVLKVVLEQCGYAVEEATRGEEGLEKLGAGKYSAIFLDLSMPGMSGFEVAATIRSRPETSAIPIILCTARTSKEDILSAAKLGIRHFIKKPFTRETVLEKIQAALGG